jgi:hypothetical protein
MAIVDGGVSPAPELNDTAPEELSPVLQIRICFQ